MNRSVNARVDWRDVGLTFFRNFPNLTLRLDDLTVANEGRFTGDTLAQVRHRFSKRYGGSRRAAAAALKMAIEVVLVVGAVFLALRG